MDKTICGHERDVLIWALDLWATISNNGVVVYSAGTGGGKVAKANAFGDVNDPAKLAEMLAERGRELGVERWEFTDWAGKALCCFRRKIGAKVQESDTRELEPAQARTILLQWLQLPNDAREEAEKVLRGET